MPSPTVITKIQNLSCECKFLADYFSWTYAFKMFLTRNYIGMKTGKEKALQTARAKQGL
jgi:hypothetical protein